MAVDTRQAAPAAPAAIGQLGVTRARMRQNLWRTCLVMGVMCSLIALFLNNFGLHRLGVKLVYSFAIGLSCWGANNTGRLLAAWWLDRRRRVLGLPVDSSFDNAGWAGVLLGLLLGFLLGPAIGLSIGDAITGSTSPSLWQFDSASTRITFVLTLAGSLVAVYVFSNIERLASVRAQAEAAQRQATETQLRLLQSQLEPHMLFNTLANLRVLIGMDPARAQAMLDRLIAFLRATLIASRATQHPLSTEFERLGDYLALMAIRMGPRLAVRLDLPDVFKDLLVPPLLLQPLVENSIQHGLEPKVAGGRIDVSARTEGGFLLLTVRDTGLGLRDTSNSPNNTTPGGTHLGLAQARERLTTMYGNRASLAIEPVLNTHADSEGGTQVTLRIPLDAAGRPKPLNAPPTT